MSALEYRWPSKEKHKVSLDGLLLEESYRPPLSANSTATDELEEDCQFTPCRDLAEEGRKKADPTEYRKRLETIGCGVCCSPPSVKAEDGGFQLGIGCGPAPVALAEAKQPASLAADCSDELWSAFTQDDDECCRSVKTCSSGGSHPVQPCHSPVAAGPAENVAMRSTASASYADDAEAVAPPSADGLRCARASPAHHRQVAEETEQLQLPVMLEAMDVAGADPPLPSAVAAVGQPASPVRVPMQCSDDDRECTASSLAAHVVYRSSVDSEADAYTWPPIFSEHLKVKHMVGCGQFGKVYVAKWHADSTTVVVKMIKEDTYRDEEFILPYKYPHENIVQMHSKVHIDRRIYLFQDYIIGCALDALWHENVQRGRTLDDADLDALGFQMLDALRHLEAHRVVHRDIKPANIIRSYRYERGIHYVLIDFGFSEQLMDEEEVRCVDGFRGSLAYSAPECCRCCPKSKVCREGYSTKADEWSLAVTLMQMCSFKVPWHHYVCSSCDLIEKLLHQPQLMQAYAKDASLVCCTSWWRDVLVRMLSPRAAARPSLEALLDDADKKRQMSLPDFGALQDDVAAGLRCRSRRTSVENPSDQFSLPDFAILEEEPSGIS